MRIYSRQYEKNDYSYKKSSINTNYSISFMPIIIDDKKQIDVICNFLWTS